MFIVWSYWNAVLGNISLNVSKTGSILKWSFTVCTVEQILLG
jgi:hypothetical protein